MRNIFISLVFGFFVLPILAQSGCVTNCVITNPSNNQIIAQPSGTALNISGNLTANGASTQLIPYIMVTFYGASGDAVSSFSLSTTAGNSTVTNATSIFAPADVGKAIEIYGVGTSGSGNYLYTTIETYISPMSVTLQTAPNSTITGISYVVMGTDNTTAINSAITYACSLPNPGVVFFPSGAYLVKNLNPIPVGCKGIGIAGAAPWLSRIIGAGSSSSDILTIKANSGPPSSVRNIAFSCVPGNGYVYNGLTLSGVSGAYVDNAWFDGGCRSGLNISKSSFVTVTNTISENNSANYFITTSGDIHLIGNMSYLANNAGFILQTSNPDSLTSKAEPILLSGNSDSQSRYAALQIFNYTNVTVDNMQAINISGGNPVDGIEVSGSSNISIVNPRISHLNQYGIKVFSNSYNINISNPSIDAMGDFTPFPSNDVSGVYIDATNTSVTIRGGSITNSAGSCIEDSASGAISEVSLLNCSLANSSVQGLVSLELAVPNSSVTGSVIVSGNTLQNTGTIRGTAINIDVGNSYSIIGNTFVGGFTTNYTNKSSGTPSNVCMNQGISATCKL